MPQFRSTAKIIALVVSAFICNGCIRQDKPSNTGHKATPIPNERVVIPFIDTLFNWCKVERTDDELKRRFIEHGPKSFQNERNYYAEATMYKGTGLDTLKKHLHVLDVNADGANDIIFEGWTGGESTEVAIFLNTVDSLKLIWKSYQRIVRIDILRDKLKHLYVTDPGCCASYLVFNKIYDMQWTGSTGYFKETYIGCHHERTFKPATYLQEPFGFK